ncbi:MAG: hypothetical protein QW745_01640 [Thermoplasmata archaeon]
MINSLLLVIGENSINLFKEFNIETIIPKIFINNKKSENVFNLPTNLIYIIESEKITTDYDDKFLDIMEDYLYYDHYFILSDIYDNFSYSSIKVFGKHFRDKITGIFIVPFSFENISKGKKIENYIFELNNIYKKFFIFKDDYLLKAFTNVPMKMLPKLKALLIQNLITNISESLDLEELKFLEKGELGFGISINERMDKLPDSLMEALESPWISKSHQNFFIIFDGNLNNEDILPALKIMENKNYRFKINKSNKGRTIYITVISY